MLPHSLSGKTKVLIKCQHLVKFQLKLLYQDFTGIRPTNELGKFIKLFLSWRMPPPPPPPHWVSISKGVFLPIKCYTVLLMSWGVVSISLTGFGKGAGICSSENLINSPNLTPSTFPESGVSSHGWGNDAQEPSDDDCWMSCRVVPKVCRFDVFKKLAWFWIQPIKKNIIRFKVAKSWQN